MGPELCARDREPAALAVAPAARAELAGRRDLRERPRQGHFIPMSREDAARKARKQLEHGYVNLYSQFRDET